MLTKPLKKCCNGCDKPPKPPSWVLCEDCFKKLDEKMQKDPPATPAIRR